jgi:hypothetical protein
MLRRLAVPALVALVAAGCASGGGQDPAPAPRTVLVDENGSVMRTDDASASGVAFAAPAAKVWPALQAAYAALDIPVTVNDTRGHQMGNTNFYKTGHLNGMPLSQFANCGNGPEGPRANSARVYFSVVTVLTAIDATHTKLVTTVTPVAVDMSGTTNARLDCESTGQLEKMLYDVVNKGLAAK